MKNSEALGRQRAKSSKIKARSSRLICARSIVHHYNDTAQRQFCKYSLPSRPTSHLSCG